MPKVDFISKKKILIIVCVVVALIIVGSIVFFLTQTPEKTLNNFVKAASEGRYEEMYEMISAESQATYSKESFVNKYQVVYEGIEAQNIAVREQEDVGGDNLRYVFAMDTVAGHFESARTSHFVREGLGGWKLEWRPEDILTYLGTDIDGRVTIVDTPAQRGKILDRSGHLLAGKGEATEVGIVPGKLNPETREADLQKLAALVGLSGEDIQGKLGQAWVTDEVQVPLTTVSDPEVEAQALTIPGVYSDTVARRSYPYGAKTGHLLGYVGAISAEELAEKGGQGYHEGSQIGKAGLEAAYEERLRGQDGQDIQVTIGENPPLSVLKKDAVDGENITTTIDVNLQTALYDQFITDKSASVAMNPRTGEVLALVSTPTYDSNAFVGGINEEAWNGLLNDPSGPLQNRFASAFSPGSSFKPLVAAAGMTAGKLDPNEDLGNSGLSWQEDSSWGGYHVTTLTAYDGPANLRNALVYSDNIYFAKAALKIGGDDLTAQLKGIGFGEVLDFPLALDASQVSESGTFANNMELANSGYGQGQVLVNPVHLAAIYSAFATEGSIVTPVLELGKTPVMLAENRYSPDTVKTIRDDLVEVVEDPAGTAHDFRIEGVSLAGKTGTAEVKASQDDTTGTELGWFCAFTADASAGQELLVVSMVEDVKDRGGSHYLLPKVKAVFGGMFG